MKMQTRLALAAGLTLGLAACGGGSEEADEEAMKAEITKQVKADLEAEAKAEEDAAAAAKKADEEKAATEAAAKKAAEEKLAAAEAAKWRDVNCSISEGDIGYDGPCQFKAEGGGSFTVRRKNGETFIGDMTQASLALSSGGQAQMRTLNKDGSRSSWVPAERLEFDKACWEGDYLVVCAD
ncbi:hypothetical protein ACFCW2_09980 [Qipengyuania sp. DSG2-2]|uniref:hypothetical protein n=1 Tax=Qipengyuania sp. DGS2-2 TaxID=3349631 RepID=UPI0036D29A1B